ncbi:MAG: choice-of-anchor J domain-containing protein [Bacteroidetes bacterium]|nr:choice-of-anchor J domain-containing protein [Bacteroidota bacterium]
MKKLIYINTLLFSILLFNGCKKKADTPPTRDLADGTTYSTSDLKTIATCSNACNHRFINEAYFKGVVIADEVSGNFYKEIYVRDAQNTGGIHMTFTVSRSNLFIGDSIRLNLKGYDVNLNASSGMLEIDSVNFERNIVKFASGANPQPRILSLSALSGTNSYSSYFCDLVTITGVSFIPADTNKIFADAIYQQSINRTIQDCGGNPIVVRTSNYAAFAQQKTPKGYGSITGIATAYGTTNQMQIRTPTELNMNGASPCFTYIKKDFNDNSITSGGWNQVSVTGSVVIWSTATFGGATFAKISGFVGTNQLSENWLISPAINLAAASNPILTFQSAAKFAGNPLEVWASTNYVSGLPSTATWTQLSGFNLGATSPGYQWAASGVTSLNAFKNTNARIAFKYTSTTSGATTYEVDDVVVREN